MERRGWGLVKRRRGSLGGDGGHEGGPERVEQHLSSPPRLLPGQGHDQPSGGSVNLVTPSATSSNDLPPLFFLSNSPQAFSMTGIGWMLVLFWDSI